MDRQDLKAQLTKTQELLSIAIKEKDTADMILEAPSGVFFFDFFFWKKRSPVKKRRGWRPRFEESSGVTKDWDAAGCGEIFRDSIR